MEKRANLKQWLQKKESALHQSNHQHRLIQLKRSVEDDNFRKSEQNTKKAKMSINSPMSIKCEARQNLRRKYKL